MTRSHIATCAAIFLSCVLSVSAQESATTANSVVPSLVRYGGVLTDTNGKPLTGVIGVTFYLYKDAQTETPLWMEIQNVRPDGNGRYSVQLGSTKPNGLPTDVFESGEARWLSVQVEGQPQQPRVLLLSVPYALKARDAETVGGLPPSAFVLAAPSSNASTVASGSVNRMAASAPPPSGAVTGTGTLNFLPLWDSTSDIISSVLFQSGTGATAKIGINNSTPAATLDVKGTGTIRGALTLPATGTATATAGYNSQPLNLAASVFNSGTGTAVSQNFRLQAEPAGNDTSGASGSLNLLYASGSNTLTETGLSIASNGLIKFANGQTFQGAGSGTVTSVGSGAGLTGGPVTSSGSLSIATGGVTNAMLQNSSLTVAAGTDLLSSGSLPVPLGGTVTLSLDTTKVPQLNTPNTFMGNLTTTGQLISTIAQGTSPLQVASTTQVPNLNASLLGSYPASAFQPAGSYATLGANFFGNSQNVIASTTAIVASNFGTGDGIDSFSYGSANNFGVMAVNENSTAGAGVYGVEGAQSSTGLGRGSAGVWGDAGNHGLIGVLATADNAAGILAINNSLTLPSLEIVNNNSGSSAPVLYAEGSAGLCQINGIGQLSCSGSITSNVPVDGGSQNVALYAVETPENWFEDVGSGQLSNGLATIHLESTFAQTVDTDMEYHVFLTPKGDCEGLYVTNETQAGFEVHELRSGHANISFDYRIMAHRKGYESIRLADVTETSNHLANEKLGLGIAPKKQ